jgi:hypothetical protein
MPTLNQLLVVEAIDYEKATALINATKHARGAKS